MVQKDASGEIDPLMGAHNAIVGKGLEIFGLRLLYGDLCPLCQVVTDIENCTCGKTHSRDEGQQIATGWISRAIECVQKVIGEKGVKH